MTLSFWVQILSHHLLWLQLFNYSNNDCLFSHKMEINNITYFRGFLWILNWIVCLQRLTHSKPWIKVSFIADVRYLYLLRRVIINLNWFNMVETFKVALLKQEFYSSQGSQHQKPIKLFENDSYLFPSSIRHPAWLEKNIRPYKDRGWAGTHQRLKVE